MAAPVFKKVSEQVLAYLEVPRDLPTNAGQTQAEVDTAQVTDYEPLEMAEPPAAPAAARPSSPAGPAAPAADSTIVLDLEGAPVAPDFIGKSLRTVAEMAVAQGLEVEFMGEGVARQQDPPPGGRLLPGRKIVIHFSR